MSSSREPRTTVDRGPAPDATPPHGQRPGTSKQHDRAPHTRGRSRTSTTLS